MTNRFLEIFNVVTLVALILATVGALVVISGSDAHYHFPQYMDDMKWLLGALGIGRGIASLGRITAPAK